jgi:hypothetical protein
VKPCLCGTDYFRKQASRRKATSLEIMGMLPTLGELLPRLDESSLVSPTAPQICWGFVPKFIDRTARAVLVSSLDHLNFTGYNIANPEFYQD